MVAYVNLGPKMAKKRGKRIKKMEIHALTKEKCEELGIEEGEGYYIDDPNGGMWVGPYDYKADATDAKKGLERFYRHDEHADPE